MKRGAGALLLIAPLVALGTAAGANHANLPGVANPAQARIDYMLKCQGCHQPDGSGNAVNTPPLAGEVARFLGVPGGREFIGRVPGVATTDLDDTRLAQLVNWTLYRFDAADLPADFHPYTAAEIARLRAHPLRLERAETRARLVAAMEVHKDK